LFGFIGSFIFGVSARVIRCFLLLKPMNDTTNIVALWFVQIGFSILVIGRFADLDQNVVSTGLILSSVGAVLYVYALRGLEPSSGQARRFAVGYER
jgi:hypothetical protein